jgi:hypothetical protein
VCHDGTWTAYFEVKLSGGDGCQYALYWDGEAVGFFVKAEERDVLVVRRPGTGTLMGTLTVESGGERVSRQTSLQEPACP